MAAERGDTAATTATVQVRRQFGAIAAAYATSAVHAAGADLAALVEAAALTGRERVLDIGCGAGHTALALAHMAASVIAIDITPEMLAVAEGLAAQRGITNVAFRLGDVAALPFPDGAFELVTSRYSAHHYAAPERALAEVARVLCPGGRFLLIDSVAPESPALDTFFNAAELLRDSSHGRNCRITEWRRMLAEAGLTPDVLLETMVDLDGADWVARSRTPAEEVAALRRLFRQASLEARQRFAIRDGDDGHGWGWRIPVALLQGTRGE